MDYDQLATNEFNQNDLCYWLWYLQEQPYDGLPPEQHYPLLTQDELFLEFDPSPLDFSQPFLTDDPILNDSLLITSSNILEFDQCRLYENDPQQPSGFEYFNHYAYDQTLGWNTNHSLDTEPSVYSVIVPIDSNLMAERESRSSASDEQIRMRRQSKRSKPKSSGLELVEIQKYFHLPITKAAKELRVGVTVLKKRCRELNIARWPHRKIKSLKTLIHNVKELGILRNENEIEMLEEQKRAVEKVPGLTLTATTKKLRQACFKANYKKRRLGQLHASTN